MEALGGPDCQFGPSAVARLLLVGAGTNAAITGNDIILSGANSRTVNFPADVVTFSVFGDGVAEADELSVLVVDAGRLGTYTVPVTVLDYETEQAARAADVAVQTHTARLIGAILADSLNERFSCSGSSRCNPTPQRYASPRQRPPLWRDLANSGASFLRSLAETQVDPFADGRGAMMLSAAGGAPHHEERFNLARRFSNAFSGMQSYQLPIQNAHGQTPVTWWTRFAYFSSVNRTADQGMSEVGVNGAVTGLDLSLGSIRIGGAYANLVGSTVLEYNRTVAERRDVRRLDRGSRWQLVMPYIGFTPSAKLRAWTAVATTVHTSSRHAQLVTPTGREVDLVWDPAARLPVSVEDTSVADDAQCGLLSDRLRSQRGGPSEGNDAFASLVSQYRLACHPSELASGLWSGQPPPSFTALLGGLSVTAFKLGSFAFDVEADTFRVALAPISSRPATDIIGPDIAAPLEPVIGPGAHPADPAAVGPTARRQRFGLSAGMPGGSSRMRIRMAVMVRADAGADVQWAEGVESARALDAAFTVRYHAPRKRVSFDVAGRVQMADLGGHGGGSRSERGVSASFRLGAVETEEGWRLTVAPRYGHAMVSASLDSAVMRSALPPRLYSGAAVPALDAELAYGFDSGAVGVVLAETYGGGGQSGPRARPPRQHQLHRILVVGKETKMRNPTLRAHIGALLLLLAASAAAAQEPRADNADLSYMLPMLEFAASYQSTVHLEPKYSGLFALSLSLHGDEYCLIPPGAVLDRAGQGLRDAGHHEVELEFTQRVFYMEVRMLQDSGGQCAVFIHLDLTLSEPATHGAWMIEEARTVHFSAPEQLATYVADTITVQLSHLVAEIENAIELLKAMSATEEQPAAVPPR